MIVNTIYGMFDDYMDVIPYWKRRIGWFYSRREYLMQFAAIIALFDYIKGREYFLKQKKKKRIDEKNAFTSMRITVIIFWRIAALVYRMKGEKAFLSYQSLYEEKKK